MTSDNPNFDVIVRAPRHQQDAEVPIGIVSKNYTLVPHQDVLRFAVEALRANGIDPASVSAVADLTQLGERMELILTLPEAYRHDPGDGHPVGLQVRCINSVDGSTRFMAVIGWLRFVCANGMVVGTATAQMRQVHNTGLVVEEISATLSRGLQTATADLRRFREWTDTVIPEQRFRRWIDGDLKKAWGVKAATRAYHIVNMGHDVNLTKPFESARPSARTIEVTGPVPGASPNRRSAYAVSQALAWLARDRRDLSERLTWMLAIPELMGELLTSP